MLANRERTGDRRKQEGNRKETGRKQETGNRTGRVVRELGELFGRGRDRVGQTDLGWQVGGSF
jgi:hypothetical protein